MRTSPRTSLHARHSNSSLTLAPQRAFTYACASRSIVRGSEFAREIFQRTCAQLRDRDSGDETGRRQQRYLVSPLSVLNVKHTQQRSMDSAAKLLERESCKAVIDDLETALPATLPASRLPLKVGAA